MMQNKTEEIKFFDSWARSKVYQEYGHFTPRGHNAIIRDFQRFIGNRLSKGCRAIDLGCGAGAFTRRLLGRVEADCYGLDISEGLIQAARRYDGKIHYLIGDIENICLEDESFDVVVFSGVLHHFPDVGKCLKEAYRILKKGGCVLAFDPNIHNPFMWFYKYFSLALFSKKGQTDNEKLILAEGFRTAMKQAGFNDVNVHAISGVTFKYVGSRLGRLLLPFYNTIEFLLGLSPFASRYGSFLIVYGEKNDFF